MAKCNTCGKNISAKAGTTSGLSKHLILHGINIRECTVFDVLRTQTPAPAGTTSSNVSDSVNSPAKVEPGRRLTSITGSAPERLENETPFTLAKKRLTKEKTQECHRAVTKFVVNGLHPFSVVESSSFRYV